LGVVPLAHTGQLQPPEEGARPLRERLAVVDAETRSLTEKRTAQSLTPAQNAEIRKRVTELAREKEKLTVELEGIRKLSQSPMVTFSGPREAARSSRGAPMNSDD
jgi:hypothetical protein